MIETIQDWNTRLGFCGCCEMPVCPEPVMVCESVTLGCDDESSLSVPEGHYGRRGCFRPFSVTEAPGDLLPRIYRVYRMAPINDVESGEYKAYGSGIDVNDIASETLAELVLNPANGRMEGRVRTLQLDNLDTGNRTVILDVDDTAASYTKGELAMVIDEVADTWDCTESTRNQKWDGLTADVGDLGAVPAWTGIPGVAPYTLPTVTAEAYVYQYFRSIDEELEEGVTIAELLAELDAEPWEDTGTGCAAALTWPLVIEGMECEEVEPTETGFERSSDLEVSMLARKIRFRFRIPDTHLGSKFTITYDIGEFPEDGDPSFFSQDNVIEWTGPGSGASSDPSWLTPWVELDPPEVPGERRIVNIRFSCYTGTKFGSKPQVMGEALDIPPP